MPFSMGLPGRMKSSFTPRRHYRSPSARLKPVGRQLDLPDVLVPGDRLDAQEAAAVIWDPTAPANPAS